MGCLCSCTYAVTAAVNSPAEQSRATHKGARRSEVQILPGWALHLCIKFRLATSFGITEPHLAWLLGHCPWGPRWGGGDGGGRGVLTGGGNSSRQEQLAYSVYLSQCLLVRALTGVRRAV
jgi:hypothetical protein